MMMMMDEGITEDLSETDASSDPRCEVSSISDDCDTLLSMSHYSSCGESEFCSAYSVFGTPSIRRSGFASIDGFDFYPISTSVLGDDEDVVVCGLGDSRLSDVSVDLCQQQCRKPSISNIIDHSNDCGSDSSVENFNSGVRQPVQLPQIRTVADSEAMDVLDLPNAPGSVIRPHNLAGSENKVDPLSGLKSCEDVDNSSNNQQECADNPKFVSISSGSSYTEKCGTVEYRVSKLLDHGCYDLDAKYKVSAEGDMLPEGDNNSESEDSICNNGSYEYQRSSLCYREEEQSHEVMNSPNKNEIMMNSSTVFGSEDWDDFVHETEVLDLPFSVLNPFHENNHYNCKSENSENTTLTSVNPSFCPQEVQIEDLTNFENKSNVEIQHTPPTFAFDFLKDDLNPSDLGNQSKEESCEIIDPILCSDDYANISEYTATKEIREFVYLPRDIDDSTDILKKKDVLMACEVTSRRDMNIENENKCTQNGTDNGSNQLVQSHVFEKLAFESSSLSKINAEKSCVLTNASENNELDLPENSKAHLSLSISHGGKRALKIDLSKGQIFPVKSAETEPNQFHDIVDEMEEILLEPRYSPEARFHKSTMFQICGNETSRDDGSTASTSGSGHRYPLKIDDIEVVGAKQRSGNVSFGERLVGVKEYTVYNLQMRSGHSTWEVERRYRDFCTLSHQIKAFYDDMGWTLPPPWLLVDKESKKFFGNSSPSFIRARSDIIQSCLRSVIHSEILSGFPDIFFWFLSPHKALPCAHISSVSQIFENNGKEHAISYGKTISLIVDNIPFKSMKQLLEAQQYLCAGCYKYFDCRKTGFSDFLQTLGWGKPRLCSYTGQLFCSSCHKSEMAVLPARVLHHWDFINYPVSQLAKSFLDSIHTQPMLCVSAVNPFLFTKVQSLLHVMGMRRQIASMLPHVHCPFLMSIYKGLHSRKYLLQSNDFFSLRDLIDLSKGAFATLPPMLETVSRRIREHITENCLVCCDVGVPCGAGVSCGDMSSLIFPFQETEVSRCGSCGLAFHKVCFKGIRECSCGWRRPIGIEGGEMGQDYNPLPGFLKGLLLKMKRGEKKEEWKEEEGPLIMMGSLPTNSSI